MLGLQRFATTWLPGARESLEKIWMNQIMIQTVAVIMMVTVINVCFNTSHVTGILDYPYYTVNVH